MIAKVNLSKLPFFNHGTNGVQRSPDAAWSTRLIPFLPLSLLLTPRCNLWVVPFKCESQIQLPVFTRGDNVQDPAIGSD